LLLIEKTFEHFTFLHMRDGRRVEFDQFSFKQLWHGLIFILSHFQRFGSKFKNDHGIWKLGFRIWNKDFLWKLKKEINAAPEVLVTVNLALQVFWLSAVHCTNSNFDANFFVYYNWIDRRLRLVSNLFEK